MTRRPVRPLIKTQKRRPDSKPSRHEPLRNVNLTATSHQQDHGRWYIEGLIRQRQRDQGAMVTYTDYANCYGIDQLMQHVLEVGHALGEAGVELPMFERHEGCIRWEFDDPAAAMMFKLKLGAMIVPPPWKSVLP